MMLTETDLTTLRAQLLSEKARLESDLGMIAEKSPSGAFETSFPDVGEDYDENASEVEEYTGAVAVEQSLETQLKDVVDALAKMDAGTYGLCEKTGQEIPLARLQAYPAARTIVSA